MLLLVALWLLLHGYHGLTGDGQIYAFQAISRLHPPLASDLYLRYTSQDEFTVFSAPYAWCIGRLGLEHAARLLTLLFTLWLLAAVWRFARPGTSRDGAWAAVALLLIIPGHYGGSGVFSILDPFLTARLPAEALIITALGSHVRGRRRLGLLLAVGAIFIHPLIALPGVLFLICLWLPIRLGVAGAIAGVCFTLALALFSAGGSHGLPVMDGEWLDVVRERSQFLFLDLWSAQDWATNAAPFLSLGLTAMAVREDAIRKLCAAAALVGAAGFAVALIGSLIGPVAILVQGQAWRWVWIGVLAGAAPAPFTAMRLWRDGDCGRLCALLLISGWILPELAGPLCLGAAALLWFVRARIARPLAGQLRWALAALLTALMIWTSTRCWAIVSPASHPGARAQAGAYALREIFALRVPAVLLCVIVWWGIRRALSYRAPLLLSAVLAALSVLVLPVAFKQSRTLSAPAEVREFEPWGNLIPPDGTVLVTPPRDVGTFVWFTLGRPNYLSLDQSAGVVFSRATALEVRRRSAVLLPLMDPDWKILSRLRAEAAGRRRRDAAVRPLTRERLIQVCADPALGFVISPQRVGFDPVPHEQAGAFKDWNLYDCRKVRAAALSSGSPGHMVPEKSGAMPLDPSR